MVVGVQKNRILWFKASKFFKKVTNVFHGNGLTFADLLEIGSNKVFAARCIRCGEALSELQRGRAALSRTQQQRANSLADGGIRAHVKAAETSLSVRPMREGGTVLARARTEPNGAYLRWVWDGFARLGGGAARRWPPAGIFG